MSILIKGMEMPNCCGNCKLYEDGYCFLLNDTVEDSSRWHNKCPLIEIPTPHGRLIDADAMLREHYNGEPDGLSFKSASVVQPAMVDKLPTIIEAEDGE